ncbi:MAG: hypothetical protein KAX39_06670, partial [candidate division Zixibacteria bacterium]|nr:hypothetical protein [candidate division Zixibacteria bacterium]
MRAIRWTQNRIPKVFFFSLVIFLISFLPLDSLRSLQVLAGQPGSESSLKGLRGPERDSFRGRGFEPNLYPCNKHPFYNPRGAPLSFSENEPGGQGKELLGSIIDDFLVNDDIAGDCDQRYSATARNPSGNFVITWEDFRNGNWDIYAQRYDSSGTPLGSNFKVNDDAGTARQMNPAIAMDVLGNFVIVWEDERSGHYHIYAQRYDSSGSPIGSNFVVNDDTGLLWQWNPAIAMDYSGNFVICWTDERDIGNLHRDIYAQRYDSSGTPLGSNFEVNDDTGAAYVDEPAIAMDPSGNFVV